MRQNSWSSILRKRALARPGVPTHARGRGGLSGLGTAHAHIAWLPVLRALGTQPWFGPPLYVSGAHRVFDASGALLDEQIKERLRTYMAGFVAFLQRRP